VCFVCFNVCNLPPNILTRSKLDTIECYERLTRQWTIVTRMPGGSKIGVAAATLRDYLYVVGGFDDSRPIDYQIASDVERYDITNDRQDRSVSQAIR